MALKVEIQKDLDEYKPKHFAGLTARTLLCLVGAVGGAVLIGAYCWWVLGIPSDYSMYIVIVFTLPFWLCGFWSPHGMPLEQFAPLWLRARFGQGRLFYKSALCKERERDLGRKGPAVLNKGYSKLLAKNKKGLEAYRPSDFAFTDSTFRNPAMKAIETVCTEKTDGQTKGVRYGHGTCESISDA